MSEQQHLWDVSHDYYCSEGAASETYENWDDFLEEMGDADEDYNLLFRWDWVSADDPDNEITVDELRLFYVHQRKGRIADITVKVSKSDEPRIIEYLRPLFAHLMGLWQPLTPTPPTASANAA